MVVANELKSRRTKVTVYHKGNGSEDLTLMDPQYEDQISELIIDHIREKLGYKIENEPPLPESTPQKKERTFNKNDENRPLRDSDNIELHVSNISLKANENELQKLFEDFGEVLRIKMLKRGTMQKAFIDMQDEKTAQAAIDELDGYEFVG